MSGIIYPCLSSSPFSPVSRRPIPSPSPPLSFLFGVGVAALVNYHGPGFGCVFVFRAGLSKRVIGMVPTASR
eukprot:scaffold100876_cov36-Tisochrysis_lutea.AAC.2